MHNKQYRFVAKLLVPMLVGLIVCLCLVMPCLAQDDAPGGDMLLSTFEGDDYDPAVAYNSHAQEFLVVWVQYGEIYGQIYDIQGVPQGGNFAISVTHTLINGKFRPAVVYSLPTDSYLVVWEDYRNLTDYDVYGQHVDADGTLLDNLSTPEDETDLDVNFSIFVGSGNQRYVDLAFDGNSYLVVWQGNYLNDSVDVLGRFVQDDGTVELAVLPMGEAGGLPYEEPAVAYNAAENEYLVVFRYGEDVGAEIRGRRVHPSGLLPGNEYIIADLPDVYQPDVAAAAWGAYVVVWSDDDISGQVVLSGADSSFDGGVFEICTATGTQSSPAIARSPSTTQFLVTWEDDRLHSTSGRDLYAQRLLADANLYGPNLVLSSAAGPQNSPAIVSSQEPDIYFVAWDDDRAGTGDIYGQRVAWTGSLLWYEFGISAQPQNQDLPDVAFNADTQEYMVVWRDTHTGDILGQRLSARGQPLEEPQVIDDEGSHGNPTVATDGSFWVVSYRDLALNEIESSILYDFGGVVTRWTIPDTAGSGYHKLVYSGPGNPYLRLWEHSDIYGAIHDTWGLIAGPFVVSAGTVAMSDPNAAWDPEHGRFLAVWDEYVGPDFGVWGRVVTTQGGFTIDKFLISANAEPGHSGLADLVYNPDEDEYLVVYGCPSGGESAICGREIAWDGDLQDSGDEFVIWQADTGVSVSNPLVVYVASVQRYAVLWKDGRNEPDNGHDLYGRWLESDGSPASPVLPFFRYPASQEAPALAYDPGREQALVTWYDHRRFTSDVYARLGALDVTPPEAFFFHLPLVGRPGTTFLFNAKPSRDNLTPRGALAVRWDWSSDGVYQTDWSLDKVITKTVGLPGTYTVTLQVRDLMSNTATVSHTVRVLPDSGNTAPDADLGADANAATVGVNFNFDASASTDAETPGSLEARWDWENDGEWNTDFGPTLTANHAYTTAGDHVVRAEVRDAEGLTDAAFFNATALPDATVALTIFPASPTLAPRQSRWFRAVGQDAYGNTMSNPAVAWSVTNPLAGTISAAGVFTAGVEDAAYPDVILAESGSATDTASVTIAWPYQFYLPLILRDF